MMFVLSTRFGMLADRHGPRFFMGVGPLVTAAGLALFLRLDEDVDYFTDLLPGLLVFGLGLSMTVAPLTSTVLADADDSNAGIASGVNNAIARVAGLVAIAAVGAVVAASFGTRLEDEVGAQVDRPEVAAAVEAAKERPLMTVELGAVPEDVAASVRRGVRGRVGGRVPRRNRDLDRAGGAGRRARAVRDPQPAPPGGGRHLRRRAACRPPARGHAALAVRLGRPGAAAAGRHAS